MMPYSSMGRVALEGHVTVMVEQEEGLPLGTVEK
jgi:hypothetical protein